MSSEWLPLQRYYERCLAEAGPTPAGVDWPNGRDLGLRFAVQLQVLEGMPPARSRPRLLDLGCGPGLLPAYLAASGTADSLDYVGMDLSPAMVACARERWPGAVFECRDILAEPLPPESVDVVLMNGVLTERREIPRESMRRMAEALVAAAFAAARHGVVFNAMSRHVDWEREELFHWGFDEVAEFLKRDVSRHCAIRADYGLYEFSAFAWRHPHHPALPARERWWEP